MARPKAKDPEFIEENVDNSNNTVDTPAYEDVENSPGEGELGHPEYGWPAYEDR